MADILDIAQSAGSFKTLVKAAQAAGLVETLKGKGPYTLFAPNDEAFAKLPAGTVEAWLKDAPKLRSILSYHVVPGRLMANDIKKMASAETVEGQDLRFDTANGIRVNGAKVTQPNIEASNGVVHIIDSVLMPK